MTTSVVNVLYDNAEKTLQIYDTGASILELVTKNSKCICPLIENGIITMNKQLGRGLSGTVYSITIDGDTRLYALKETKVPILAVPVSHLSGKDKITVLRKLSKSMNVDFEVLENLNISVPDTIEKDTIISVPASSTFCSPFESYTIASNLDKSPMTFPKGTYLCEESMTEYLISLILGEVRRREESIFFIDTFAFAACRKQNTTNYAYFTFMEQVDGTLTELFRQTNLDNIEVEHLNNVNAVIVHILIAVAQMQKLGIQHNDLHLENVFYQKITDDTMYKNQRLINYDYFAITFDDLTVYTTNPGYIIKIGDFGLSLKFSEPMVLNKKVMYRDNLHPNFRYDMHDPLMVLSRFVRFRFFFAAKLLKNVLLGKNTEETFTMTNYTDVYGVPHMSGYAKYKDINAKSILNTLDDVWFQKPEGTIAYL